MTKEKILTEDEIEKVKNLLSSSAGQRAIQRETGLSRRQITKITKTIDAGRAGYDRKPSKMSKEDASLAIHALSIRPQGVKNSELPKILAAHFGYRKNKETGFGELDMSKAQLDYLKKKVRAISGSSLQPLFVPDWLPRTAPVAAVKILLGCASDLQDRINEMVNEFCDQFPECPPYLLYQELVRIAVSGTTKEPVERRCERNMLVAEGLETRLKVNWTSIERKPLSPIIDAELNMSCI